MKKGGSKISIKRDISLIIPVYNEQNTLKKIIDQCSKQKTVKQLIIVNDGSTDKTALILNRLKNKFQTPKLTIINHKVNLGKGAAIRDGLKIAAGKYIMVQDADLEYSPDDIKTLYIAAENSKDKIIFGTRSQNKKKSYLLAQLGNYYLNQMFNRLFNLKLTDSYTCYKLMPREVWDKLKLYSNGFEIDAELVSKLGKKGYRVVEVPIFYNPRKYSEGKKINWLDLIRASLVSIKIKFSN